MAVIEAIETIYLEADAALVTFDLSSSPANTYEHLQFRISARCDRASNPHDAILLNFNNDTGTNYSNHSIYAGNTAKGAQPSTGDSAVVVWGVSAQSLAATVYAGIVVDILDYRNGSKNTTIQYSAGSEPAAYTLYFGSGLWDATAAVTEIDLTVHNGTDFMRGSEFTLYGLNSS